MFLPSGSRIPVLLLGNKSDLLDEGHTACIPTADLDNFLAANSFYAHFLCSAKTGANVREACTHLVAKIHTNNQAESSSAEQAEGERGTAGSAQAAGRRDDRADGARQPIKLAEADSKAEPRAGCC